MYIQWEELLELLWEGSRRRSRERRARGGRRSIESGLDQPSLADLSPSDAHDAPLEAQTLHGTSSVSLSIPHTVIFKGGHLQSWYFSQNGEIKKKRKANLTKKNVIDEFLKLSHPGQYVAILLVTQEGNDGIFTTQRRNLEEFAFSKLVKAAFTTHFTGIIQQYVSGELRELLPWVKNPPPDPRLVGQGVLECQWSKTSNTIIIRCESELAALSHFCSKVKGKDGRMREKRISSIIHLNYEFVDSHTQRANILKDLRRASDSLDEQQRGVSSPSMMDSRASLFADLRAATRNKEQERIPQIGGTDFLAYGKGCVISMHERDKVLAASKAVNELIANSLTARGESPTLVSLLAHFKLSDRGRLQLHWGTAVLSVPSEHEHVRTFVPGDPESRWYVEVLQAVSLDSFSFLRFANLQDDVRKNVIKSLDYRAVSMDLSEWFHFLRVLKLLPARLTKEEATSLFRKAISSSKEENTDANEMSFIEFKRALRLLASLLQLDWEPVELAGKISHLLLHRRFFQQNASGSPGEQSIAVTQFL
ncbi:hypothetical protein GUITHDRAFT_145368, partial [Guillardia theta CCMP2712]